MWFRLAALALLGALQGCATPLTQAIRDATPEGPRRAELADTPFFPQVDYYCGPAALATVLRRAGGTQTPEELQSQVYLPGRQGSLQLEIVAAARRAGFLATRLPGDFATLIAEIRAGNAVLVLQNLGLDFAPSWHYSVAIGYDLDEEELILRSGDEPRMRMGLKVFERTWRRAGHWALVVTPPGRLATTAGEDEQARAIAGLERLSPPAAVAAYQAALARWPAQPVFHLGLANALHGAGDPAAAAATLDRLLALEPEHPVALNNRASLFLEAGDLPAARRAAERALAHAGQWRPAIVDTLERIAATEARQHR